MKKVLLVLLDGFGMRGSTEYNAVTSAQMHIYDDFLFSNPHTLLDASDESIGLLNGHVSTCEFSFETMGLGKNVVSNELLVKNFLEAEEIDNPSFFDMTSDPSKTFHIISFADDLNIKFSILLYNKLLRKGVKNICYHLVCDNNSSLDQSVRDLCTVFKNNKIGSIVSICGSDYSFFDENNLYYETDLIDAITKGNAPFYNSLLDIVSKLKAANLPLNKVKPFLLSEKKLIGSDDVIFICDINKQLPKQCIKKISSINSVYSFFNLLKDDTVKYFIEEDGCNDTLGIYLQNLGLKQARVTTDEKMYLFTNFFDKDKTNIDLIGLPVNNNFEASSVDITRKVVDLMDEDYDFIVVNYPFANDYAKLGDYNSVVKSLMSFDICLGKLLEEAENNFYTVILSSDHGNVENMENGSNTNSQVPFIINDSKIKLSESGNISNLAPTILDYMNISIPSSMTSHSLIVK